MGSMRYDAVFFDVDGTLLYVDFDVEGYASDLAPYSSEELSAEEVRGPVWESMRMHISENMNYRTAEELRTFKRENALRTAGTLGIEAPPGVLAEVAERRILFKPYEESEVVLGELKDLGLPLYVVSNWDVLLEEVLEDLGWLDYFDGVVASAVVGYEKPDERLFEEALRVSGVKPGRAIHVGNDVVADIEGASAAGIDTFLVNRKGFASGAEATYTGSDLRRLPAILRGRE